MMDILARLSFLRPGWLWLLCAVPLIALWGLRARRDDVWSRVVDPQLLPYLVNRSPTRRGRGAWALAALAVLVAALAMAGPSWRHGEQRIWPQVAPLMIVLDLSRAVLEDDVAPSRLLQARARIADLLEHHPGQVGLVVFAEDAFTVAPMTDEAGNVAMFLDALAPDIMPADGHRPERALRRSARMLERAGFKGGDILLMTHAADGEVRDAATALAREGYRVSVLGLGGDRVTASAAAAEVAQQARLDEASLRAVADAGSGRYARIAMGGGDLDALDLPGSAAGVREDNGHSVIASRLDDGYWLLLPLLVLALFALRRGVLLPVLMLGLWLPALPAAAQSSGTLFKRQDQIQHEALTRGAEAYRSGNYDEAVRLWSGVEGPVAAYNRGNALARAGRYQDALSAYDEALRAMPDMDDAIANRRAVEAYLQRQPPAQSGDGDEQRRQRGRDPAPQPEDGQGESSGSPESSESGAEPDPRESPGSPDSGDRPDPSEGDGPAEQADGDRSSDADPAEEPVDAEAQAEADQALQQAVEAALRAEQADRRREGEGGPASDDAGRTEREARDADEALLRRVRDDPGGLLRARFWLEHQQRRRGGGE